MSERNEHYKGHRSRLRRRFRNSGRQALADYELLELLLGYSIGRMDTKPLAKKLIETFGSFSEVFDRPAADLEGVDGVGEQTSTLITLVKACVTRYLEPELNDTPVLDSPEKVTVYMRSEIGSQKTESFMLLCLDSAGRLIHKEIISKGTVSQAHVYPREVLRSAIVNNASALVLVHNHPSGTLKPSLQDEGLTKVLTDLSANLGIAVHDHLIVTKDAAYSMKLGRCLD